MVRVFANDLGSIPGWDKAKNQKEILDASLFKIQYYKDQGLVQQSKERSSLLPYSLV